MADREKVIKGLEQFKADLKPFCGNHADWERFDAGLSLLKEQEAKNGEWITIWQEDDPDTSIHAKCSICSRISERPLDGYCKWCGAKMGQE